MYGVSAIVLPAYFVERRLGVEAFDVAGAADHEQPDDALGLAGEVRLAVGRPPGFSWQLLANAVAGEHRAERQAGEAHADVGAGTARRWLLTKRAAHGAIIGSSQSRCG